MKYKLFCLFLGALFILSPSFASAQTVITQCYETRTNMFGSFQVEIPCSGTPTTSGTTSPAPATTPPTTTTSMPTSLTGPCTGELLTNQAASENCAQRAQAQAIAMGYDAACVSERVTFPGFDPNTGLDYYFNSTCTINGSAGHGAYLLAGFDAAAGSTALIKHINPGWNILSAELQMEKTCFIASECQSFCPGGAPPITSGSRFTCPGGTLSSSPNRQISSGQSASGAGSTSAYINSLMNIVRSMIAASQSVQSVITKNTTTQNTNPAIQYPTNTVTPTATNQSTTGATTNTTTGSQCITFASGWVGCVPSVTPVAPIITSFPATITVNVALLNVRSAPNTQAVVIKQLAQGETFLAGNVIDGENVEGTGKWWVTVVGTAPAYIWAGGTVESPEI